MKITSEDEELTEVEFMLLQQFYEQQGIRMQTVKEDFLLHPTLPEWKIVFALSIRLLLPHVVMKTSTIWNNICLPTLHLSVVTLGCQLVAADAAPKIGELPYQYRTSASSRSLKTGWSEKCWYRQTLHLTSSTRPRAARGQRKHGGTAPTGGQGAAYLPRSMYTYCLRTYVCNIRTYVNVGVRTMR